MVHFENNLGYLIRQPVDSLAKTPVLILLHGYGSNEKDLFSFANKVPKDWLVLSVRGTISQEGNRYCWYNVTLVDNKITMNFEEEEDSRKAILNFIDYAVQKYNGDKNKVVLAGFSQGANMSLVSALTAPEKVAGFGMFSGRFVEEVRPIISTSSSLASLKGFIAHGSRDNMLPIHYAEENRATLRRLGIAAKYSEDATGHTISPQQFEDFITWLHQF